MSNEFYWDSVPNETIEEDSLLSYSLVLSFKFFVDVFFVCFAEPNKPMKTDQYISDRPGPKKGHKRDEFLVYRQDTTVGMSFQNQVIDVLHRPSSATRHRPIQSLKRRRRQDDLCRRPEQIIAFEKNQSFENIKQGKTDKSQAEEYLRRYVRIHLVQFRIVSQHSSLNFLRWLMCSSVREVEPHISKALSRSLRYSHNASKSQTKAHLSAALMPLSVKVMASALESKPRYVSSFVESMIRCSSVLDTTKLQQLGTNHGKANEAPGIVDKNWSGIVGSTSNQFASGTVKVGKTVGKKSRINIIVFGLVSSGKTTLVSSIKGKTNLKCRPRYDSMNSFTGLFFLAEL